MKITDFAIMGTKLPMIPNGTHYTTTHWGESDSHSITENKYNLISYGSVKHYGVYYILAEIEGYKGNAPFCIMGVDIVRLAKEQGMIGGELIGYKCPTDIGSYNIKKGTIFAKNSHNIGRYIPTTGSVLMLPNEIVESWEAVYGEISKTIKIGRSDTEVTINKHGVFVGDVKLNIDNVRTLLISPTNRITRFKHGITHEPYPVQLLDATYKIGCSEFKLIDLIKVVNTYDEINGKD